MIMVVVAKHSTINISRNWAQWCTSVFTVPEKEQEFMVTLYYTVR